jgi:hypothetical protein
MEIGELVNAAVAGFDRREMITIPRSRIWNSGPV